MGGIITLTTDFGLDDPWVGVMKGVILSIAPDATIVDLTHGIPPQDIKMGAYCLAAIGDSFPKGTVHVCVVDPGVGSSRNAVIVRTERYFFVGPDNGVFTFPDSRVKKTVLIKNNEFLRPFISATFHGRDVFAPVAAHLLTAPIEDFGPRIKGPKKLPLPSPRKRKDGGVWGEVIYFDRFGNAITNIRKDTLIRFGKKRLVIGAKNFSISGLSYYYSAARDGAPGAIINGFGLLELFTPNGNVRETLGLKTGDRITVTQSGRI